MSDRRERRRKSAPRRVPYSYAVDARTRDAPYAFVRTGKQGFVRKCGRILA